MPKKWPWCILFALAATGLISGAEGQPGNSKQSEPKRAEELAFHGKSLAYWRMQLTKDDPLDVEEAIAVLATAGPKAIQALPELTKLLNVENRSIRFQASIALWKIARQGKEAVPALVEALKDPQNDWRLLAIETVTEIGPEAKEAAPYLAAALADRNPELVHRAAQALAQIGTEAAPFLAQGLGLADPTIRQFCAGVIGRLPPSAGKAVNAKLTASLKDQDVQVRYAAAEALWRMVHRGDAVAEVLEGVLGNKNISLHKAAADLLCRIRPRPAQATNGFTRLLKDPDFSLCVKAAEALWELHHDPQEIRPAVLRVLGAPKGTPERANASAILIRMGPAAKEFLQMLIDQEESPPGQPNSLPFQDIVRAIGPEAAPMVMKLFERDDNWTRHWRSIFVAAVGPETVPALLRLVKEKDSKTRQAAIHALAMLGPAASNAIPTLITVAKTDNDDVVRKMAVETLGHMGPGGKATVPLMLAILKDRGSDMRLSAIIALSQMRFDDKSALPILDVVVNSTAPPLSLLALELRWRVDANKKNAVEALAELAKEKKWRGEALEIWARYPELLDAKNPDLVQAFQRAVPSLADGLANELPASRKGAAVCLGHLGKLARPALPALKAALADKEPAVRQHVAEAIRQIGGDDVKAAAEVFRQDLHAADLKIATQAHEAVRRFGPMASNLVEEIRSQLSDKRLEWRILAAETLSAIDPGEREVAIHVLLKTLSAIPSIRQRAARVLCVLDGVKARYVDIITPGLTDPSPAARQIAVFGLAQLGENAKSAAPVLEWALDDELPQVRMGAARALCEIGVGSQRGVDFLIAGLQDPGNAGLRTLAAAYLGQIGPAAKDAVPALTEALKDRSLNVRRSAAEALLKVDRQAAQAAGLPWN